MKKTYFLDTNVILRFLLNDHRILSKKAKAQFQKAKDNKIILFTTNLVLAELIWVLKSVYQKKLNQIYSSIEELIAYKNFHTIDKKLTQQALRLSIQKNISFIDACNFLEAKKRNIKLITFDQKLARLSC